MVIYSNNNVTNDIHDNTASVSTLLLAITARGVVEHTARTLNLKWNRIFPNSNFLLLRGCIDAHPILTPLMNGIALMGGVEVESIRGTLKRLKSKNRKLDIVSPYKIQKLGIVSPYIWGKNGQSFPPI